MYAKVRRTLVLAVVAAVASGLLLQAASGAPSNGQRFEATFTETRVSTTDRSADLGIVQFINTGTGTVEGYGAATMVLGVTQDRSVQPCGPGSSSNAGLRRIVLDAGVLVLHASARVCQTSTGPVAHETWIVEGAASTGVFAGARGSGQGTVDIPTRTSRLSGKLRLAK